MQLFGVKSNTKVIQYSCIYGTISNFYVKIWPSLNMSLKKTCKFQNYLLPLHRP